MSGKKKKDMSGVEVGPQFSPQHHLSLLCLEAEMKRGPAEEKVYSVLLAYPD
jgi:hypothetical protein